MKKVLLVAVVTLCALVSANAQIGQGTILVGAGSNFGFTSVSPDGGDSYTRFDLQGKVGYFFIDNLTAGINLDYNKVDDESLLGFGVFGRYYLNNVIILGATLGTAKYDNGDT